MRRQPLISVIVSAFNAEATIASAIRSILRQSVSEFELLIADDGSTDRTLATIREFDDPRITVLSDGRNLGMARRLNEMIDRARGEYIARMDADDLMMPRRLETQLDFLRGQPEVDVVDSGAYIAWPGSGVVGKRVAPLHVTAVRALDSGLLIHPAVMAVADWFRSHRYSARFLRGQDRELWARSLRDTTFARVPQPLIVYFDNPESSHAMYRANMRSGRRTIRLHGPNLIGPVATAALLSRSCLKETFHRVSHTFGIRTSLYARRNEALSCDEHRFVTDWCRQCGRMFDQ